MNGRTSIKVSVLDGMSERDRHVIDAAAHAWINAGGDSDGVVWNWKLLAQRVRELMEEGQ